ncbi:alpha/beta fold hydrolase [Actinomycetes bacterium M1A6_2h]
MIRTLTLPGDPARVVVFLHGMGSAGVPAFGRVASDPTFDGRLRVIPDLMGFGFSDRPADFDYTLTSHADSVASLLDDQRLRQIDVVGHSMGGSIAIVLAQRRTDLVRSLTVLEPNLVAWDGDASVRIARQTENDFVRAGYEQLLTEVDAEWASTLRVCDPRALHRSALGLCTASVLGTLLDLQIPRSYIFGARTKPPEGVESMRAADVHVTQIADAGHNMMVDNASGVVEAIAHFLGT